MSGRDVVMETRRSSYAALVLATAAFALCFTVWGPLAPQFQQEYALSNTQISLIIATPIILGSIFWIPLGLSTGRFGGVRDCFEEDRT